jgi:hypothetical protein
VKINHKAELVALLGEIHDNCGDFRGRDGEFLSDAVGKAYDMADSLDLELEEHELPGD